MLINKFKSPGKFAPVFKTETKPAQRGKHSFDMVQIDTDTLCDDNDNQEILIGVFAYNSSGNHKKISQGYTSYGDLKNANGATVTIAGTNNCKINIVGFKI